MKVLVLGGAGFIGRHAVVALQAAGHQVVVGSRRPARVSDRLTRAGAGMDGEARAIRMEQLCSAVLWSDALRDIDAVVNCVGILRQRGRESYDKVHLQAPTALASACRERSLRLVHVSALGLEHDHRSRFLRSKRAAERMLVNSGADYCLVRPSLLDGEGGFGAAWLRCAAQLPCHLLPAGPAGRIAALDVRDLGEALARLTTLALPADTTAAGREFDLGGLVARDLADYLQALRADRGDGRALTLRLPATLARLVSHVCDLLHFSPFSFGHWELLRHDNLPGRNRLPELLGRQPRAVGMAPSPLPAVSADLSSPPSQVRRLTDGRH